MRRQTELILIGCLELLALGLANLHALAGVQTDEAKYLLNIPYPHPPLMRTLMSWTEAMPYHELFWRFLLASLMLQAVWLVWDMCRTFHLEDRVLVCAGWLLSSAVLVQSGSLMLGPVNAVQLLALLWLRARPELGKKFPQYIALFWLASLFTAYQAVLFLPLAWSVLRRSKQTTMMTVFYIFAPVALLILWTLSNPLAIATMVIHQNEGFRDSLMSHLPGALKLWVIGGAGVVSVVGTWGILRSRDIALMASFALVCAFAFLSISYRFYAILFTPLFVGGLYALFHGRHHPHAFPILACLLPACAIVTWFARPYTDPSVARTVMEAISMQKSDVQEILIEGSFGHQWQYESTATIRRYKPEFAKNAQAIVCLNACEPMFNTKEWKVLSELPVETWVRK